MFRHMLVGVVLVVAVASVGAAQYPGYGYGYYQSYNPNNWANNYNAMMYHHNLIRAQQDAWIEQEAMRAMIWQQQFNGMRVNVRNRGDHAILRFPNGARVRVEFDD